MSLETNPPLASSMCPMNGKNEKWKMKKMLHTTARRHLKTYRIPFAQPNQVTPTDLRRSVSLVGTRVD